MRSGNVMRAISSLCVRPKAASFFHIWSDELSQNLDCSCDECYDDYENNSDDDEDGNAPIAEQIISYHQLEMTLKDWPKVSLISVCFIIQFVIGLSFFVHFIGSICQTDSNSA